MNESLVRWVIIPGIIFLFLLIGRQLRKKVVKPSYKNNVQTPGKFDKFLLTLMIILTIIPVTLMVIGLIMKEIEMAMVSAILTLVFIGIILLLKRGYAMSYQENDEFFILKTKKKEVQVFYENIVDWQVGINEISLLDWTSDPHKYINVNISIFKPDILLKKIAEKTFSGHFLKIDPYIMEDLNREQELIEFYHLNGYDYLLKDYVIDFKKVE
ncbi:hypothetical protein [Streptococcus zalophi]|uniref:Uncharacterized protein n=1 Tax=Streptococcus zalophi TaxID=640031 RepID=A0A934P8W0_9STRE|nr:hypothetical protein [Streptococcus zalophi]MBJ8349116.1 hypothetical protein [Streptococcus zalophi]